MKTSVKINPFTKEQMRELDLAAKERRVCEIKAKAIGDDKVTYEFEIKIGKHGGDKFYVDLWEDDELIVYVNINYTEPNRKAPFGGGGYAEKFYKLVELGAERFICKHFEFEKKEPQGWNGTFSQLSLF